MGVVGVQVAGAVLRGAQVHHACTTLSSSLDSHKLSICTFVSTNQEGAVIVRFEGDCSSTICRSDMKILKNILL